MLVFVAVGFVSSHGQIIASRSHREPTPICRGSGHLDPPDGAVEVTIIWHVSDRVPVPNVVRDFLANIPQLRNFIRHERLTPGQRHKPLQKTGVLVSLRRTKNADRVDCHQRFFRQSKDLFFRGLARVVSTVGYENQRFLIALPFGDVFERLSVRHTTQSGPPWGADNIEAPATARHR